MKKLLISLIFLVPLLAFGRTKNYSATITNQAEFVAATTTNTTAGAVVDLSDSANKTGVLLDGVSIWARCSGLNAGTTNTTGNATLVIYLSRSWDNIWYESATNSDIRLVIPLNGIVTNQVSVYRNLGGARYIQVSRTENIALAAVTNIVVGISGNYNE